MGKYTIYVENDVIIGRVYKITNNITEKIYIGSCIESLNYRMRTHLNERKCKNSKLYTHMRDIGARHFKICLISHHAINNIQELRTLEQMEINKYNPGILLNSRNPSPKYKEIIEIVKPIIEELIEKVFEIKIDDINEKEN